MYVAVNADSSCSGRRHLCTILPFHNARSSTKAVVTGASQAQTRAFSRPLLVRTHDDTANSTQSRPPPPAAPTHQTQHVLQWLDLASHLRLREASRFDRDETPRRTTTLAARDCEQARRCQEKIFTADKNTRLHSITLDIAAPNSSRSSFRGGGGGSSSGNSSPPPPPRTHHLWSYNSSFSSFLDEASCAARRAALPLLVREHRPAELW